MIEEALGASTVFGVEVGGAAAALREYVESLERFEENSALRAGAHRRTDLEILSDANWKEVVVSARSARLELSKALAEALNG